MTIRKTIIGVMLLMLVSLQYRLWVGEGSLAQVDDLSRRVETAKVANEVKRQRNEVLKAEIIDLKDGFDAIEEKARSEWGLIKKDETFFLLVDQD